ncbi:Thiosulfate sulfurtransferase GlpE [uncultured archaeon]|nr:Thiosulfate sulfurtransferase GlpE [uncultured archaeon]
MYRNLSPQEFLKDPARFYAIDVRSQPEWDWTHEPQAIHIPLPELMARAGELPNDKPLVFICRTGGRSLRAAQVADGMGYEAYNLAGGMMMLLMAKKEKGLIPAQECERLMGGL